MQALLGWTILIIGIAAIGLILRRHRKAPRDPRVKAKPDFGPTFSIVQAHENSLEPYPYIYVNADGSARELHQGEREYLETSFHPADGGRPYVKNRYTAKDGWGSLAGFLKRSKLPSQTVVQPPPLDNPSKPLSKEDQIEFLRSKGLLVTENPDGSFTAKKPTH